MRFLNSITPALIAISLSNTDAAATVPPVHPECIVPFVIFNSLSNPFTLSAIASAIPTSNSAHAIPVRIVPPTPTREEFSKPIISNARIASTKFKLKDGKLVVQGFKAKLLPFIEILPPVLRAFVWGGDSSSSPLNFTAGFACDNTGKSFLRLSINEGSFAVKKYAEGQQVFIKPIGFQGQATDVDLKVNEGV